MKHLGMLASAIALGAVVTFSGPALAFEGGGRGGPGGSGHMGGVGVGHAGGMHRGGNGGFEGRSVGVNRGYRRHWHGNGPCLPPYFCNGY